jgi:4-carboxymuconolactone decarboxylase
LCISRIWRAQYEWHAHAPIAEKAGVKPDTIRDIKGGRTPKKAAKDELAIWDFVQDLFKTRRVSSRNYKRVHAVLGDKGTVELVGIIGYYAGVSMVLNVFNVPLPEGATPYFAEPK